MVLTFMQTIKDKSENVCSMEIVIRNMIFWKKKWVDYKNYT